MKKKYYSDETSKECSECRQIKNNSEFYKHKKYKIRSVCKECEKNKIKKYREENKEKVKLAKKEWNKKNKDKTKLYDKNKRTKNQALLEKILEDYGCQICGEKLLQCLQYHHIRKLTKEEREHNDYITCFRSSKTKMLNEIERCAVLCRTCHTKVHHYELDAELKPVNVSKYRDNIDLNKHIEIKIDRNYLPTT